MSAVTAGVDATTLGVDAVALGVDVGGTTIKSAVIGAGGALRDFQRVETPRDDAGGTATAAVIARIIGEYSATNALVGVGVAVPGIVDDGSGVVLASANLGWIDLPIKRMIEEASGHTVALGHDVRSGAVAEAIVDDPSSGRTDHGRVTVFVPIGTGIAAATVIEGVPVVSEGWAGEIGQVAVPVNQTRLDVVPLTVEGVASAAAIARRLGCVDARTAAAMVASGDPVAALVWADAIEALADALAWVTAVVGADRIIVGGGLAESGDLLMLPLRDALDARLGILRRPRLARARFGDRAATIGAGILVHRAALGSSTHPPSPTHEGTPTRQETS